MSHIINKVKWAHKLNDAKTKVVKRLVKKKVFAHSLIWNSQQPHVKMTEINLSHSFYMQKSTSNPTTTSRRMFTSKSAGPLSSTAHMKSLSSDCALMVGVQEQAGSVKTWHNISHAKVNFHSICTTSMTWRSTTATLPDAPLGGSARNKYGSGWCDGMRRGLRPKVEQ